MNSWAPEEWERELAFALLDPACAGAAKLDEAEKAALARIRHFVPTAGVGR